MASSPERPTRACPDCDGRGWRDEWVAPGFLHGDAEARDCVYCRGTGRLAIYEPVTTEYAEDPLGGAW